MSGTRANEANRAALTSSPVRAISRELDVSEEAVVDVIELFDSYPSPGEAYNPQYHKVGAMLSYTRKWLRDRLRRAGQPNPLTGTPAVA